MEICSKIPFGILNKCISFRKDYDIVSIELRKDIHMIKYADSIYVHKFIECNFDLEKTLEAMKP